MARLGEFGAARAAADPNRERDTMTICGTEFNVADEIDPIAALEFGEAAASGLDTESPEGYSAMLAVIRGSVDEEDWPRFRRVIRQNRPDPAVLMEMAMAVLGRETGRPTVQPSDSSDGLLPTTESSKASSSSEVSSPLGAVPPIMLDPRVKALVPVDKVGLSLVG